jgi:hypothetical protein
MPKEDLSEQGIWSMALGFSALGYGGSLAITHFIDVDDGDAAFIASSAQWATLYTMMIGFLIDEDFFEDETLWMSVALAGGDLGLTGAALFSNQVNMSSGRVMLINLGGYLGALLGGGILTLAEPDEAKTAVATTLITSALGLGLTTYFTRNYDAPDVPVSTGSLIEYSQDGWAFGIPMPRMMPVKTDDVQTIGVEVPLVSGVY